MAKVIPFQTRVGTADTGTLSSGLSRRSGGGYNRRSMSEQIAEIPRRGEPFLVGDWLVEPTLNRITRAGVSVQLELRAVDVLLCLADHAGEVVPKDVLFDTVWQTEFVSDNTLATYVAVLRSAFGDDAQQPRYIETIRKRGYRLIAEVRPVTAEDEAASVVVPETVPPPDEERNPYPGLAAFTEADAQNFFGREAEEAALWRRITSRRLLAVIGPSGVGKSSLLRAGVAPRAPAGWRVVVFTPGEAPALSLARALAPDHASDPAAMARLLGFSDTDTALAVVARWRGLFDEAVLVVDQFEELFTLNPPEVQASFIDLLRRLVDAADVHLVLAMRDDYLYRCQEFDQIAPIFRELTPLPPPKAEGLRRALKEPTARQLYRFENELLVDRIVSEVEGERGALPMMAFAVHRLWEERDRERRELTEEAYERIGGVAGALAKHADATLERIGPERLPVVRELFRNLVTAEGTRAIREVNELLSVYPEERREAAEEVLRELIDARLLTGYREQNHDERPVHRVEIVHESLLTSWPRLVRWRTQDADSARLRDELRQAARLWDDHGRANDYLWTGKAFREFAVWREGYPGGLTDVEEDFASAMTTHATRSRRRRRIAVAVIFAVLLAVLGVVAASRQQAVAEARRAEAAKLLALGQLRLEDYPTATLAHAIASLELADSAEARRLALRALWEGPTALIASDNACRQLAFGANGDVLVESSKDYGGEHLRLVSKDGSSRLLPRVHEGDWAIIQWDPLGRTFSSLPNLEMGTRQNGVVWSMSDGRILNETWFEPPLWFEFRVGAWTDSRRLMLVREGDQPNLWGFNYDGTSDRLGALDLEPDYSTWYLRTAMDPEVGRWFAWVVDNEVSVVETGDRELLAPRVLGRHEGSGHRLVFDPRGRYLATSTVDGRIKIWDPQGVAPPSVFEGPAGIIGLSVDRDHCPLDVTVSKEGSLSEWFYSVEDDEPRLLRIIEVGRMGSAAMLDTSCRLYAYSGPTNITRLWSLSAPWDAEPLVLRRGSTAAPRALDFHPDGTWLATGDTSGMAMWLLGKRYPSVIRVPPNAVRVVRFGPDGKSLAAGFEDGDVRVIPLGGEVPAPSRLLLDGNGPRVDGIDASSDNRQLIVGRIIGGAFLLSMDGGHRSELGALNDVTGVAYSADGRLAAAVGVDGDSKYRIHVWKTDTWEETAVIESKGATSGPLHFLDNGRIVSCGSSGLWVSNPTTGRSERLFGGICGTFSVSADGRKIAVVEFSRFGEDEHGRVIMLDVDVGSQTQVVSHGDRVLSVALDMAGSTIATGDIEGVLRVGPTSGDDPHMLLGNEGRIWSVDIDPKGRWVASGGQDATVRIWPMPDLSKPPLHNLPHDELMAKLKSLTNLRVVRDKEAETGWTLTHDPFPGWETVPTW